MMNRCLAAALSGLGLALCPAAPAQAERGRDPQHPRWFASYELARAEARKAARPLFVVFRCVP